jgi:hypothetical protein
MKQIVLILCAVAAVLVNGCTRSVKTMSPKDEAEWVIRTDFSDEGRWAAICDMIAAEQRDFEFVKYVSEIRRKDQAIVDLVRSLPDSYPGMFCFVVDRQCIENPEHPILVVGFYPSDGESFDRLPRNTPEKDIATFRALPSQIWAIQANLSLANMDFEEFAGAIDADGVFRGSRR